MFPYDSQQTSDNGEGDDGPSFFFPPGFTTLSYPPSPPPLQQQYLISFQIPNIAARQFSDRPPLPPPHRVGEENVTTTGRRKIANKNLIIHREAERRRREEMATLNASLRALLPLRFVKGRRGASDQMEAAVGYIRELQRRIGELGKKRDELKSGTATTTRADDHQGSSSSRSNSCSGGDHGAIASADIVLVQPCLIGVEVAINIGGREDDQQGGSQLFKVIELLTEQGLDVVTCDTVRVNDRLIHTLKSKVSDDHSSCIDVAELQRLLTRALWGLH